VSNIPRYLHSLTDSNVTPLTLNWVSGSRLITENGYHGLIIVDVYVSIHLTDLVVSEAHGGSLLATLNHPQIVISDEMAFHDQVTWSGLRLHPCLSPLQYWKGLDNSLLLVTLAVALEYMINITEGGYFLL